jgi:hypothetical protein
VCNGVCRDLQGDRTNCGTCGNRCGTGLQCVAGQCQCPVGQTSCNGVCRNLQTDRTNCGTCGTVCPGTANQSGCVNGGCVCSVGLTQCGTTCANLAFDPNNCGACGVQCTAAQACKLSVCGPP